jgi:plasmid stabilization system protein ParE
VTATERREILWLAEARENRRSQLDWIAEHNPAAAIRIGDLISQSILRLADFPTSARPGRVPGTRELVVSDTPFIIVYRVEPDAIVILRLLHHRRKWP